MRRGFSACIEARAVNYEKAFRLGDQDHVHRVHYEAYAENNSNIELLLGGQTNGNFELNKWEE